MSEATKAAVGLDYLGIQTSRRVNWNLATPELLEQALVRGEGNLSEAGALIVRTGDCTGRSPNDKFVVETANVKDQIWWGKINQPMSPEVFDHLYQRVCAHLKDREIYVMDGIACADAK